MRHMYETEDALTERRPLCTVLPHHHPVHPEPVCAQCASIGMHLKSATIHELRVAVAELEAELQRLRTDGRTSSEAPMNPYRREADVEVIARQIMVTHAEWQDVTELSREIAAALSDATNGGHWEEGDEAYNRAADAGLPRRFEWVDEGLVVQSTLYGWVPADPDAARRHP